MNNSTLVTLILAVTLLAGCQEPPETSGSLPEVPPETHAFAATYTSSAGTFIIELGQANQVMDADGQIVPAYPLQIYEPSGDGKSNHAVFWVTGDLRLLRVDHLCITYPCPNYRAVSWTIRGAFPPIGLGYNKLAEAHATETVWNTSLGTSLQILDSQPLRIKSSGLEIWPFPYMARGDTYVYQDSDIVPDQMLVGTTKIQRTKFELKEILQPIPPLRPLPPRAGAQAVGNWFPGSDQAIFGNWSIDQAMDALTQTSQNYRTNGVNQCVVHIATFPEKQTPGTLGTGLASSVKQRFQARTYSPGTLVDKIWDWEHQTSQIQQQWVASPPGDQQVRQAHDCQPGGVRHSLAMNMQEFLVLANEQPIAYSKDVYAVAVRLHRPFFGPVNPDLDLVFQASFAAPNANGALSTFTVAPQLGVRLEITGTDAELGALAGTLGWPS